MILLIALIRNKTTFLLTSMDFLKMQKQAPRSNNPILGAGYFRGLILECFDTK